MGTGEKQNARSTAYDVCSHQGGSYLRRWIQPFLFFRTTLPLHPVSWIRLKPVSLAGEPRAETDESTCSSPFCAGIVKLEDHSSHRESRLGSCDHTWGGEGLGRTLCKVRDCRKTPHLTRLHPWPLIPKAPKKARCPRL